MIVFRRFLRDRRRSAIGWTIGIFLFFLLQNAFYPSFKDQPNISEMFEDFGDMLEVFGISSEISLVSPPGWVQGQVFAFLPVLVVIFTISLGTRALATSEEDGTLELLLANPVDRRRVVSERLVGFLALTVAVTTAAGLLTLATLPLLQLTDGVSWAGYFASLLGTVGLGVLFGGLSFAVGASTGRRGLAIGVGAAAALVTYVMNSLAGSVDAAHGLRFFTPFHWFLGRNMLAQGIAVEALTLPFALAALFVAVGVWRFLLRDLQSG